MRTLPPMLSQKVADMFDQLDRVHQAMMAHAAMADQQKFDHQSNHQTGIAKWHTIHRNRSLAFAEQARHLRTRLAAMVDRPVASLLADAATKSRPANCGDTRHNGQAT
jgi:hypothetical protein